MQPNLIHDTIIAPATAPGRSAIALVRLTGPQAIEQVAAVFKGKDLRSQAPHSLHFGRLADPTGRTIDEVVVSLFRAPRSFTGQDVAEISCHGSPYITEQIIRLFMDRGVRLALPGEFTQRAFLTGRLDLAQAEAVADLINADNEAAHQAAMHQMRGHVFERLKGLRDQLADFAALLELELDFSEEDVEFAHRDKLTALLRDLHAEVARLAASFRQGNAIKNGIPVVIAGRPNAGKSTLLNWLLQEERAIVSEIAGTTRDVIEDEMTLRGLRFRFIDTAGLRQATDRIEAMGIERTRQKMQQASIIIYLFDAAETTTEMLAEDLAALHEGKELILAGNKMETASTAHRQELSERYPQIIWLSALQRQGEEALEEALWQQANLADFRIGDAVVTNLRHFEHLDAARQALAASIDGLAVLTTELVAQDIREALRHLGALTGEVSPDEVLGRIFSKFCIGK